MFCPNCNSYRSCQTYRDINSNFLEKFASHILLILRTWRYQYFINNFFPLQGGIAPQWARTSSFTIFLDHTQRRTTVCRTPLDVWSARRRDLYLTTHNTHNRQTSMPQVWFEPKVSASERQQTHALDRAATGTGLSSSIYLPLIFQGPCVMIKTGCIEVMEHLVFTFCICLNASTNYLGCVMSKFGMIAKYKADNLNTILCRCHEIWEPWLPGPLWATPGM